MGKDYLLHHQLIRTCEDLPDKTAVACGDKSLTFKQLSQHSAWLAKKILELGIQKGDRVAFFLDHDINQAISIYAISTAGGVFVPVNALLFPNQVLHIVKDSGARILITTKQRHENIQEVLSKCPDLEYVIFAEDFEQDDGLWRNSGAIEGDLCCLLYTSGSSGRPKGVMISHKNLLAGCWIISEYLNLTGSDSLLGLLPLSFDYGLNQLVTMIALGGTYRFLTFRFPNEIVDALVEHEITGLAGIPPIWAVLVRSSLQRTKLPHLRYITNSGGAVPTAVLEKLKKFMPTTEIVLMYGLTEAFRSTYLPPRELDNRPTSMGKAIPNTEIFVVSKEGKVCGPNETGELVHRGPTVSLGYWNRPEETAKRFRPYPWDPEPEMVMEWSVFSGDLVYKDEEGFLYFVGRDDAMIKCSGNRISPTEIEEIIFQTGLVKQAAAIGVSDSVAGQAVKIFIVPLDGDEHSPEELEKKIIDHCVSVMPNYMVPRFVEVMEDIPKTATGKYDYPALKKKG